MSAILIPPGIHSSINFADLTLHCEEPDRGIQQENDDRYHEDAWAIVFWPFLPEV